MLKKGHDKKYLNRQALRLSRKIKKSFAKQLRYLQKEIKKINQNNAIEERDIDRIVNNIPEQDQITDDIIYVIPFIMNRSSDQFIRLLDFKEEAKAIKVTEKQIDNKVTQKKNIETQIGGKNIHNTTKDNIRKILKNFESNEDIINAIKDSYVFSDDRALLIGEIETRRNYSDGKFITAKNAIVAGAAVSLQKRWRTVGDSQVRDTHYQNEGDGWIGIFDIHSGTNEDTAPSADFNCRCDEEFMR